MEGKDSQSVWQISGGPGMRSYADVFLKYGVGLIGPGDAGAWKQGREDVDFDGGFVRRFATEAKVGDIFLLRTTSSQISAVGVVASDYLYLNQFDDVNGWDLQHARRIRWFRLPEPYDFEKPVFGANPPRLSRIGNAPVIEYATKFANSSPTSWQEAPLPDLPLEEPLLSEMPSFLRDFEGVAHDLFSLYWDPETFGNPVLEDELVAHLVIPFLRALGWPPELIAVKWRNIDVCVFNRLPRTPANCELIVEAKRLGSGIEGALKQAKSYLENLGIRRDIVVTDGIRYRVYSHNDDFRPVSYANLAWTKGSVVELFSRLKRR